MTDREQARQVIARTLYWYHRGCFPFRNGPPGPEFRMADAILAMLDAKGLTVERYERREVMPLDAA